MHQYEKRLKGMGYYSDIVKAERGLYLTQFVPGIAEMYGKGWTPHLVFPAASIPSWVISSFSAYYDFDEETGCGSREYLHPTLGINLLKSSSHYYGGSPKDPYHVFTLELRNQTATQEEAVEAAHKFKDAIHKTIDGWIDETEENIKTLQREIRDFKKYRRSM